MTLGIANATSAQTPTWGWWSEEDSIASPIPEESEFLSGIHGGSRVDLASSPDGRGSSEAFAIDLRRKEFDAKLSATCDSSCVRTHQELSWSTGSLDFTFGDLRAWPEEPLLEGVMPKSVAPSPWGLLGSGNGVSGIDAAVRGRSLVDRDAEIRIRASDDVSGGLRISSVGQVGWLRAGLVAGTDSSTPPIGLAGIRLRTDLVQLDASHLGRLGDGAWRLALDSRSGEYSQGVELLHVPGSILHDRMPSLSPGATRATIKSRWSRSTSSFSGQGQILSDSNGTLAIRTLGAVATEAIGVQWRIRSRWSKTRTSQSSAIIPGIARSGGRFRPWGELVVQDDRTVAPSTGVRWLDRSWSLDLSSHRRSDGHWDWSGTSMLTRNGSGLELEVGLQNRQWKGGGKWTSKW